MVKSGKISYKSHEPGTWEDVQRNMEKGVTIAMHNLQNRHGPIHQLCAELEDELEIFLGANSYLTPGGSIGFDPHWDWHDILVIQLEGSKTWTVCEQRDVDIYRFRNGVIDGIFPPGEDFGVCTEYVFQPGDIFYAPLGTIHYAKANKEDTKNTQQYSMHLTLSLGRQQFTWGQFLQDVAESDTRFYSSKLSSIVASNKKLQKQIPITSLHTVARSLDNSDLPSSFLVDLQVQAVDLVTQELTTTPRLQSFLLSQLEETKTVFKETIDLFRYKMVMGRLKGTASCPTSKVLEDYDSLFFQRRSNQRIMLEEFEDNVVLVTGSAEDEQHLFPIRWRKGLRWALGASVEESHGSFFTVQELMLKGDLYHVDAIEMLKHLLNGCLLEWRRENGSQGEQEGSCAAT